MADREQQGVTPHLCIDGCSGAIDFYKNALGAEEYLCMRSEDGRVMHAQIGIARTTVILCDPQLDLGARAIQELGGSPVGFYVYVANVDDAVRRAVDAGAKLVLPVADMAWGDRIGAVADPFGFRWTLATHTHDVPAEDMRRALEP